MKFVQLHKPLGTPVLLNLDNVDYFDLDGSKNVTAYMTGGDRVTLQEKLDEIERTCGVEVREQGERTPTRSRGRTPSFAQRAAPACGRRLVSPKDFSAESRFARYV
jgi:hypothetical protein